MWNVKEKRLSLLSAGLYLIFLGSAELKNLGHKVSVIILGLSREPLANTLCKLIVKKYLSILSSHCNNKVYLELYMDLC